MIDECPHGDDSRECPICEGCADDDGRMRDGDEVPA